MKKTLVILGLLCALSLVVVISAAVMYTFNVNMTATVATQGTVTVTINGQNYANGQAITLNWGTVQWGANTQSITIINNANVAVTPSLAASSLPSGWTLTLSLNQAIAAGQQATGTLTLDVPSGSSSGTYSSMTATIIASY